MHTPFADQIATAELDLAHAVRRRLPLLELRARYEALDRVLTDALRHAREQARTHPAPEGWTTEANRLADVRDLHRLDAASMAGVLVPFTVQVGSYYASGPCVAGLCAGSADSTVTVEHPAIGLAHAA